MSRRFIIISVLFFLFLNFASVVGITQDTQGSRNKAGPGPAPTGLITMDFQNANLKDVLKVFSQQAGLNFVASQAVQERTVTLYFENVTIEDALRQLIDANNLIYEQPEDSNIFIVKEVVKPVVETITRVYELKFAQLAGVAVKEGETPEAEIKSVLEKLLTEKGKIVTDKRSNSIIITDVPGQFPIIEETLVRLDIRTQQVMIEAEILEVDTTLLEKLGIEWTTGTTAGILATYNPPQRTTAAPFRGDFAKDTGASGDITVGTLMFGSGPTTTLATLQALYSNSSTKILARPKVLTVNNETAKIEITAQTAVASITTTTGAAAVGGVTAISAERIETGIVLSVTPQINKDSYVTMQIEPKVTIPVASKFFTGTTQFVDPQTRSTKTTVMVKDGETVVIGGLISAEDTAGFKKIPFLGDIPIFGELFQYRSKDNSDKELIIFITPHIVKEELPRIGRISEREQEGSLKKKKEVELLLKLLSQ